MRLALLTALTMIAFAGNSLLNRLAVGMGGMDAASFALIRVVAGAVVLLALVARRRDRGLPEIGRGSVAGVLGLSAYLAVFSLADLALGAGTGALILFGTVQLTMFAGAALRGRAPGQAQMLGAAVAFAGLLILLWPGTAPAAVAPVMAMMVAGVGWGVYSLPGGKAADPLGRTAVNFMWATPVIALFWWLHGAAALTGPGFTLAVMSGVVTSGLGYALWYAVLPGLGAQRAAVAQLTVPVIAAAGGAIWLGEEVGLRFVAAAGLVLLGVALASLTQGKPVQET